MNRSATTAHSRRGRLAVLLAAAALALTACSGSGDSESSSGSDAGSAGDGAGAGDVDSPKGIAPAEDSLGFQSRNASESDVSVENTASQVNQAPRVAVQGQLFIRTGRVTVVSKDLDAARDAVDRMVARYGGTVADEQTRNEADGEVRSSELTLRIPSARFGTVMGSFDDLGAVQGTSSEQQEVTTEVIDVASRISTQEVSLGRLRGFLGRATNVTAMIRLEGEIARREADLASLRGQQDYLDDQTSLSTIELTLEAEDLASPPVEEEDALENAGFLSGLSNGWNALTDVLLVVATVLGAALPFLLVLALIGVPLTLWLRATRRTPPTPPEPVAG